MSGLCHSSRAAVLILAFGALLSCVHTGNFSTSRSHSSESDATWVRVLLFSAHGPVTISSSGGIRLSDPIRNMNAQGTAPKSLTFRPGAIAGPVTVESLNSYIEVNGRKYRGSIELHPKYDLIHVVNAVRMDEYLLSVVPGEIPAGWEPEALKAQAVAARTYTYFHLIQNRGKGGGLYDLDATSKSQVYGGTDVEKPGTSEAVMKTAGEVIVHNDLPIISYFHSTCGGKTIDAGFVWNQNDLSYLRGVRCGFCTDSTKYLWETRLDIHEIRSCLSKKQGPIGAVTGISFKKKDGRVSLVSVRHTSGLVKISGNNFRLMFPDDRLRSLFFTSKKTPSGIILSGRGWGHGVGMCQWGANGMAKKRHGYRTILKHYYSNVSIVRIKDSRVAADFKQ